MEKVRQDRLPELGPRPVPRLKDKGNCEAVVKQLDTDFITFTVASNHGPDLDIYGMIREQHSSRSFRWLYHFDGERIAGYLTEENLADWQNRLKRD